jgi:hypothetical protein
MAGASSIPAVISFSDKGYARMATQPVSSLETTQNQEIDWALEQRVYRSLARSYILELQKQNSRKKRATTVALAMLSTAFFITVIATVYWGAYPSGPHPGNERGKLPPQGQQAKTVPEGAPLGGLSGESDADFQGRPTIRPKLAPRGGSQDARSSRPRKSLKPKRVIRNYSIRAASR